MSALATLTNRQRQVADLIKEGHGNRQIAEKLNLKPMVVKNYLRGVYDKLGVFDRLELAVYMVNHEEPESCGGME
jgi:DNA-binding NarL/FixJ family response regulator